MLETKSPSACLVTGGAGFIGSHVVQALLEISGLADMQVVVMDDLSGGFRENVPDDPRVHFVEGSVADDHLVETLFSRYRFRWVYHLAAYAAEGLSHFIRCFNYTNNVIGSTTLINAAVRYEAECFVFTSSIAVYGAAAVPMTESITPRPEDPYGIAKYAVELDLAAATRMFGLDSIVFRPHNVYGERQNIGDAYRNVIGIFMNRLLQGRPMPVFGDGSQRRAFTYIGDIASLIARAPQVPRARNRVFNVGSDRVTTVGGLATAVSQAMGMPERVEYLAARNEVHEAFASHALAREVFGGGDETPLDEGLRRMAAWVRRVGARQTEEFTGIEVRRNLPPAWQEWG